uniref:condensation domain-containing protein n=1 Tax=Nocardia alni TaxID=2815723 RepID=UPI0020B30332
MSEQTMNSADHEQNPPATLSFPASFAQQRMWFLHKLDPADPSYHVPLLLRMRGPLDIAALGGAFEDTIARQEQLRTSFADVDGDLHQRVHPYGRFELGLHNVEAGYVADADLVAHPGVAELLSRLIDAPFDLGQADALRAEVIELGGEDRLLAIVVHHIVIDGWSLKILLNELDVCYRARVAGTPVTLPELSIQYADYAEWQHDRTDRAALDAELAHWRTLFPHGLTDPNLPTDRPRPLERSSNGARHEFDIDAETAGAARQLARADGATLYMVLLAAWAATISRASGGCDTVTAATLLANRDNPQIVDLIGLFVNTLPIPVDLSGQPTFRTLLERVRRTTMDVFAHQDAPIEQIVPALRRPHDTGEVTFPLLFALQNFADSRIRFADLDVVRIDEDERSTRFELELHVWEHPDRLRAAIVYSTDLFDPDTVARLGRTFVTILRSCCATPDRNPDRIPLPAEAVHP